MRSRARIPLLALFAIAGAASLVPDSPAVSEARSSSASASEASPDTALASESLDTLLAVQRTLSATLAARGARAGYLEWLARDAIVFSPAPIPGRSAWLARSDQGPTLVRGADFAEVSGNGDLGFVTGPWEVRSSTPQTAPTAGAGHYVAMWRRAEDGRWQLALDAQVEHERPAGGADEAAAEPGPVHPPLPFERAPAAGFNVGMAMIASGTGMGIGLGSTLSPADQRYREMAHEIHGMMSAERSFAFDLRGKGAIKAYANRAAEDLRLYRDGLLPTIGVMGAAAVAGQRSGSLEWIPLGNRVSSSYDLGYSYGLVTVRARGAARPDTNSYLHAWRKSDTGQWQLVIDLENHLSQSPRLE